MSRRPTQNERILALLSDGKPHSFHEVLRHVPCVVHSRMAELRSRGHVIVCARTGDDYLYRLVAPLSESAAALGEGPDDTSSLSAARPDSLSGSGVPPLNDPDRAGRLSHEEGHYGGSGSLSGARATIGHESVGDNEGAGRNPDDEHAALGRGTNPVAASEPGAAQLSLLDTPRRRERYAA